MAITVTTATPNDFEQTYTYASLATSDATAAIPIWAGERVMLQLTAYTYSGAGATGVACQTSLDGTNWAQAYEGAGAALAIEAIAPTAANGRVYSVQPARFLRLVVAAGVTSAQAIVVVRRSAEAALS